MKKLILLLLLSVTFSYNVLAESLPLELQSFQNGTTKKYFTKGHPKAKGIEMVTEYPNAWEAMEGERPNIVQKFMRPAGKDLMSVMYLILIKNLPKEASRFSDNDIADLAKEMFSRENLQHLTPANSKLIQTKASTYDGQSGAITSFSQVQEKMGIKLLSYTVNHPFIYSHNIVQIQCYVAGLESQSGELEDLFTQYLPVFYQIGNSIVLLDKWNKESFNEEVSVSEIAFGEYWWLTLIFSALLTWGVGLLPPVLVRFVFVKKSLSKKSAILFVSVFWILNLIFFIAIGSQSKAHAALFLVAWASYTILHKGYKPKEVKP